MSERTKRLKRLLDLLEKLRSFHETRHATFLAGAIAARAEAQEIISRTDDPGSLALLFPEVYSRRIADALAREQTSSAAAQAEAKLVATASARRDSVHENWQVSVNADARKREEREALEAAERIRPRQRLA